PLAWTFLLIFIPLGGRLSFFSSLRQNAHVHEEGPRESDCRIASIASHQGWAENCPFSTAASRLSISAAQAVSLSESKSSSSKLRSNSCVIAARSRSGSPLRRSKRLRVALVIFHPNQIVHRCVWT